MHGGARPKSDRAGVDATPRKDGCDDTGSEKAQYGNQGNPVSTLAHGTIPWQATNSDDTPPSMSSDLGRKFPLLITCRLRPFGCRHARSPPPNRLQQLAPLVPR
jgi:hypothetical protein